MVGLPSTLAYNTDEYVQQFCINIKLHGDDIQNAIRFFNNMFTAWYSIMHKVPNSWGIQTMNTHLHPSGIFFIAVIWFNIISDN